MTSQTLWTVELADNGFPTWQRIREICLVILSKFLKQRDQLISIYLRKKMSVLMLKISLGSYREDKNKLTKRRLRAV